MQLDTTFPRAALSALPLRAPDGAMTIHHAVAPCQLGRVLIGATERGVCAVFLGDEEDVLRKALRERFPKARLLRSGTDMAEWMSAARAVVDGEGSAAALPLDVRGTTFQRDVWAALGQIRPGETTTYAELARAVETPAATRAVANACGANPVAVVIPCHRVLRSDGALGGYRWGISRKKALLLRESGARESIFSKGGRAARP